MGRWVCPPDFQMSSPQPSIHTRRAARARELAKRFPASVEPLRFIAEVVDKQARLDKLISDSAEYGARTPHGPVNDPSLLAQLAQHSGPLIELVLRNGPRPLRDAALRLDEAGCCEMLDRFLRREDTTSPGSFFARVLLQAVWASRTPNPEPSTNVEPDPPSPPTATCAGCGHAPQLVVRRPVGDGSELRLMCSLCLAPRPFPRSQCPACGESVGKRIAYYGAGDEFPHLSVRACESCRRYLVQVDLMKEPKAVPDIDEMAALPLDVWATGQGLRKLYPNLLGI